MLPYFPFDDDLWAMTMGVRPLGDAPLIEVDVQRYETEIALKQAQLGDDHRFYFQAQPRTEAMQWEAVELLLPNLARHYPQHFRLEIQGAHWTWCNRLLGSTTSFQLGDRTALPYKPLDWLGRHVQDDLLLLDGNQPSVPLVAGQLCFANVWSLNDKLGKSFLAIHDPIPRFGTAIGQPAQLLMERLKAGRPVWRVNWAVKASDQLNLPPHIDETQWKAAVTVENAGVRCFFRVERQMLARLERTNAILFTVHTYLVPISELAQSPQWKQRLWGVLQSTPPDVLAYKGITPFVEPLKQYLTPD